MKAGLRCRRCVVKPADTLRATIEEDADIAYDDTRLARQARRARPRLALLLAMAAAGLVLESVLTGAFGWLVAAAVIAAAAWGVRADRLGAHVAAALIALLLVVLPLRLLLLGGLDAGDLVTNGAAMLLGAAMLPDIVTLLRDAELQHAYGLWAGRS